MLNTSLYRKAHLVVMKATRALHCYYISSTDGRTQAQRHYYFQGYVDDKGL